MLVNNYKISVFSSKNNWPQVLGSEEVLCFAKSQFASNERFLIDFNSLQGDNITFRFSQKSKEVTQKLLDSLQVIMKKCPPANNAATLPAKGFFMDFPGNSVFLGLSDELDNQPKLVSRSDFFNIRTTVSKLILERLIQENVDEDDVFFFLFELQVRMAEIFFGSLEQAQVKMKSVVDLLSSRFSLDAIVKVDRRLMEIFNENIHDFRNIGENLWQLEKRKENLWLECWKTTCMQLDSDPTKAEILFVKVSTLIFEQLNVTDNYKLLLSCKLLYNILILK